MSNKGDIMIGSLTKLSSGDYIHIESSDIELIYEILERYCCPDCLSEIEDMVEYNYGYGCDTDIDSKLAVLLGTACGAEFFYEEIEDE